MGSAIDAVVPIGEALVWVVAVFGIVLTSAALFKKPLEQLIYVRSGRRDRDALMGLRREIEEFKQSLISLPDRVSGYQNELTKSITLTTAKELVMLARVLNQLGIPTPDPKIRNRKKWVYFLTALEVSARHGDLADAVRVGKAYAEQSDTE